MDGSHNCPDGVTKIEESSIGVRYVPAVGAAWVPRAGAARAGAARAGAARAGAAGDSAHWPSALRSFGVPRALTPGGSCATNPLPQGERGAKTPATVRPPGLAGTSVRHTVKQRDQTRRGRDGDTPHVENRRVHTIRRLNLCGSANFSIKSGVPYSCGIAPVTAITNGSDHEADNLSHVPRRLGSGRHTCR